MVRIYGVTTTSGGGGEGVGGGGNVPSVLLRGISTSNAVVYLTTDASGIETPSNMLVIPPSSSAIFSAHIVASYRDATVKTASWTLSGLTRRSSSVSSITIVNISSASILSDTEMESAKIELAENTASGGISIKCFGVLGYTVINWAATITLTEV